MRNIFFIIVVILLSGCAQLDQALLKTNQAVAKPDRVTGRSSINLYNRDTEIKSGNKAAESLIQEMTRQGIKLNEEADAENYARLNNIMNRILSVSHMREESGWKLYLVEENQFNAFVTGGNIIFVYTGLLNVAKTDDEIATVLGHEIGHISAGHVSEGGSFSLAAKLAKSKSSKTELFKNSFTMQQEREADSIGILYTALAGYDPKAGAEIWQKMQKKTGSNAGVIHNHPINSERMAYMKDLADKVSIYYTPNQINLDFAQILDNNVLWKKETSTAKTGVGATMETLADYYVKREKTKIEARNQAQRINIINGIKSNIMLVGNQAISADTVETLVTPKSSFKNLHTITFAMILQCTDGNREATADQDGRMIGGKVYSVKFKFDQGINGCNYKNGAVRVDSFQ